MYIDKNELISIIYGNEELLNWQKELFIEYVNCCTMYDVPQNCIPCSERLPISSNKEPYDTNLVVLNTNEVMIGIYRNHEEKWWVINFEELNYHISNEVIAWMPLPTYKEEK